MAAGTSVTPSNSYGNFLTGSFVLDPASVAGGAAGTHTVAVAEAAIGDVAIITSRTALTAGNVISNVRVSAAGTISFSTENTTAGAIDEASGTWDYALIRNRRR